jgi:hypothetical protein
VVTREENQTCFNGNSVTVASGLINAFLAIPTAYELSLAWVSTHSKVSSFVLQVSNTQSSSPMTSVVVIHGLRADSRPTTVQNVLSHSRYFPADEVLNVNIFGLIPDVTQTDVVILTYDFLALRTWPIWNVLVKRVSSLIDAASTRIAMPQDDYTNCDVLDEAVCQLGITHYVSRSTYGVC